MKREIRGGAYCHRNSVENKGCKESPSEVVGFESLRLSSGSLEADASTYTDEIVDAMDAL